ncbi:MAG: single-stranded DNA-binding protein [Candidatus Marinimicrobia bacterium]|nr:single-stranded DNA-binding protein [Candidatus Neomarinimicrobiota bacterium]
MDQSSTNKVILIGRLGQEPELKTIPSGQSVANISIATSEKFKNNKGEFTEKTEWHRCVCWGQTAEFVGKYLNKGALVYVEGKLQTRKWQDKNGNNQYSTEIHVNQLTPLGSKKDIPPKNNSEEDDLPDFLKEDLSNNSSGMNDLPDDEKDWPF